MVGIQLSWLIAKHHHDWWCQWAQCQSCPLLGQNFLVGGITCPWIHGLNVTSMTILEDSAQVDIAEIVFSME